MNTDSHTLPEWGEITIGVVADTHVPDRKRALDARLLTAFRDARADAILHAGDVSVPSILAQFGQIAPVYAVGGNRDWVALRHLPAGRQIAFGPVLVGLAHGHGRPWHYIIDRLDYLVAGYRLEIFAPRLLSAFPEARVVVFGHTHRALSTWVDGKLLFNPGSPHFPDEKEALPSYGLLHISARGEVNGEILTLPPDEQRS